MEFEPLPSKLNEREPKNDFLMYPVKYEDYMYILYVESRFVLKKYA